MNVYGELTKITPQDDGTIIVEGIASTETKDAQGEIVKADAMRAALPEYMKFGAVREMHKANAAGTAIAAHVDEDGRTHLEALIVDPVAIKKVEAGVYKGFSIGGRYTGRDTLNKAIVTGVDITEISLVDRPANPECRITLYKADGAEPEPEGDGGVIKAAEATPPDPAVDVIQKAAVDELAKLLNTGEVSPVELLDLAKRKFSAGERKDDAKSGKAMPGGSFPIENGTDLENAIKAVGRAKDPEAAKAHIKARAKALGLEDKLPDSWKGDGKKAEKAQTVADLKKYMGEEVWDSSQAVNALQTVMNLLIKEAGEDEPEAGQVADLKAAVERIKAFIASEVQEDNAGPGDNMQLAAKIEGLAKMGARNSTADKGRLEAIHKAVVDLGYDGCTGKTEKADTIMDLAKLGKVSAETVGDLLNKIAADNADMCARLAKLEAQPAPAKGALRAVAKGQDVVIDNDAAPEPDLSKMSGDERAAYEMKKALGNPQMIKLG